jgi:hypothetical protein
MEKSDEEKVGDEDEGEDEDFYDYNFEYDKTQPITTDIVRPLQLERTIDGLTIPTIAALSGHVDIVEYLQTLPGYEDYVSY